MRTKELGGRLNRLSLGDLDHHVGRVQYGDGGLGKIARLAHCIERYSQDSRGKGEKMMTCSKCIGWRPTHPRPLLPFRYLDDVLNDTGGWSHFLELAYLYLHM